VSDTPERSGRGLLLILGATVISGVMGYVVQLLAPAQLSDPVAYLSFSVFWSALFLFVGTIGGVQQEVTRASRPVDRPTGDGTLRTFTLVGAGALITVTIVVGLILAPRAFPADPFAMSIWFGIGILGYLLVSVFAGVMYGLSLWLPIAGLTFIDGVVRGVLVTAGLLMHASPMVLAAFVSVPFILAFGVVWLLARRRVIGRFRLDVGLRRLLLNTLGTMTAAVATGIMVSGLPLLMQLTIHSASAQALASLVLVITLTRAPFIIPLIALQSFLIVDFRAAGRRVWSRLVRYVLLLGSATTLAAVLAFFWGPTIVEFISSGRYDVSAPVMAGIVASAGLVAFLCLTGPALLGEDSHGLYVAGWAVAAIATVALLLLPGDATARTMLALLVGPVLGLAVHVTGIAVRTRTMMREHHG
jgi:hypothetical protein